MIVSVVICTKNRAAPLERCLRAFAQLRPLEGAELIVVDNGSDDRTGEVAKDCATMLSIPLRVISCDAPGIGHAMNKGLHSSHAPIVAFTDDDCYPEENYLHALCASFQSDPAVGFVAGRILLHDPQDAPITIMESATSYSLPAGKLLPPGHVHGANLAFRRIALEEVQGFDPLFGPGSYIGSGADCDAAARVCLRGWAGMYDPNVVVRHHHGRKQEDVPNLMRRYAIGRGGFFAKMALKEGRPLMAARAFASSLLHDRRDLGMVQSQLIGSLRYAKAFVGLVRP